MANTGHGMFYFRRWPMPHETEKIRSWVGHGRSNNSARKDPPDSQKKAVNRYLSYCNNYNCFRIIGSATGHLPSVFRGCSPERKAADWGK
ncbi:hypothetical protein GGQ85_003672 [Nitrobacter vulgaris]|nr:hypothetical protein [Nitrobacter vulgaris]